MMLIKMNAVFYLFVVLCWTSSQATAATLCNNKELPRKKVLDTFSQPNSKSDGALPILHVVFDIASGENVKTDSTATRNLLNKLLSPTRNFDSETMMSVSTFTGIDSGDGNYLKVLSPPVNVIENHGALIDIIQIDIPASITDNADVTRDPGAAIRDAVNIFSKFNPDTADILYVVC